MNTAPSKTGGPQGPNPITNLVTITINGKPYEVTRGSHKVIDLKQLAGIPPADELAEVRNGQLHPLQDNQSVGIQGGEQFLSSPRSSPNA